MKKSKDQGLVITTDYRQFIEDLKSRVTSARVSAARFVNRELILLYWDIGRAIVEKQQMSGWGESVVELISADLRKAFPQMIGFSSRNVWGMRRLYESYTTSEFLSQVMRDIDHGETKSILQQPVAELGQTHKQLQPESKLTNANVFAFLQQLVAEIPWGHHLHILNKLNDPSARLYYLRATARFGWSRNVLFNQINAGAYERAVAQRKSHNFPDALPEHLAEQADEMLKSSYNLEFLGINRAVKERELEDRLIERLRDFILELGYGFCFVGRQHRLALGKKEYFIDLLFYHRFLKALVAFELKIGSFEPEYAGKMDFYLNLLNDKERAPGDQASIGIILCAEKDDIEVEYALRTKKNPIGVAVYHLQTKLPKNLRGKLPTAEQLSTIVRTLPPARNSK